MNVKTVWSCAVHVSCSWLIDDHTICLSSAVCISNQPGSNPDLGCTDPATPVCSAPDGQYGGVCGEYIGECVHGCMLVYDDFKNRHCVIRLHAYL